MIDRLLPAAAILVLWSPAVLADNAGIETDCGDVYRPGGVGPYDWYDPTIRRELDIVVNHHFTPFIEEMAINGSTSRAPRTTEERFGGRGLEGDHLDYTLRAIPNHPRALNAMAMWQLRLRRESMTKYSQKLRSGRFRTAECYFQRAMTFRPNDGMVRMAYAVFLHQQGLNAAARESYGRTLALLPNSAEAHYNLGLLLVEMNDFAAAREHARKAYDLGYPLPGLKAALASRGEWNVPDESSETIAP